METLRRMRWLDSTLGSDSSVPAPFAPMSAHKDAQGRYIIHALNKQMVLDPASGLPLQISTQANKTRQGQAQPVEYPLLAEPLHFELLAHNASVPLKSGPVQVDASRGDLISWTCTSTGTAGRATIQLTVQGEMDFTGYGTLNMTVAATNGAASLSDIRFRAVANQTHARYVVGLGQGAQSVGTPLQWLWNADQAHNGVWVGRMEGGLFVMPRGEGTAWDNPLFSKDFPQIPFIPPSWGGVNATMPNVTSTSTGVSVSADGEVLAWSGPRQLAAGQSLEYLLNFAVTPSKPIDWASHWRQRIFQVGYGTPYYSPQQVKGKGASVVTLHQGTPGIVNNSLVNPYINYPCGCGGRWRGGVGGERGSGEGG